MRMYAYQWGVQSAGVSQRVLHCEEDYSGMTIAGCNIVLMASDDSSAASGSLYIGHHCSSPKYTWIKGRHHPEQIDLYRLESRRRN